MTERPELRVLGTEHGVACHFAEELTEPVRREKLITTAAVATSGRTTPDEELVVEPLAPPTAAEVPDSRLA